MTRARSPTSAISPPSSPTSARDLDLVVDHRAHDARTGAHDGAGQDHRLAHGRAVLHHRAAADHRALHRAGDDRRRPQQRALDPRARAHPHGGAPPGGVREDRPAGRVEVDRRLVGEQVHVALPVRLDGPHVAPVAVEARLARAAALDQPRQRLVPEVLRLVQLLERVEQRVGLEDEDLVGHQVARGLVRLVLVVRDPPVLRLDDAVAPGVVRIDLGGHHRHRRAALHVLLHQLGVVQGVHRVGAHDHERLRRELADQRRVAPQGVRRAAREAAAAVVALPGLEHQQAADRAVEVPRPPVGEVVAERDRVELLDDPDVGEPGVVAVAEREVDQPVAARERHRGLGALLGEQLEPPSRPTGEHDDERLPHEPRKRSATERKKSDRVMTPITRPSSVTGRISTRWWRKISATSASE